MPILHWKLDDTGTTFKEEVTGNTSNSVAVNTVTTGQAALAPDGGSSISLTDDNPGSYIDAGTVQSDGTYVAGNDSDFRILSGAFSVTAWASYTTSTSSDQVIVSSDWDSNTGWDLGFRNDEIFIDFGSDRKWTGNGTVATNTTYLISVRVDDTRTVFGGGVNAYSISFWDGSTWTHSDGTGSRSIRLQGLEIGSFQNGANQINGTIDDVRIYDHALRQADLDALVGATPSAFDGFVTDAGLDPASTGQPHLDPDFDSLQTGIEWVVGGNPNSSTSDTDKAPTGATVNAAPDGDMTPSDYLLFTYRRTDEANLDGDTTIAVEYGSNLTGWTTASHGVAGVVIAETDEGFGTGVDRVEVFIPTSLAASGKLFARLNVAISAP